MTRLLSLICCVGLLLTACGSPLSTQPTAVVTPTAEPGFAGGLTPELAVQSFIETLGQALRDPDLSDLETRRGWIDLLAAHFVASERTDQRAVIANSLAGFVRATRQRDPSRAKLVLEFRIERYELANLSDDGQRATVTPVNGRLVLLFQTDRGLNEGEVVPLEQLLGRADFPTILVGDRWFLTETVRSR